MTKWTNGILAFLVICIPAYAHAGAWTQAKGAGQLITSSYFYTTDEYWDTAAKRQSQPNYYKEEISAYGEYGLRDDITLGARLSLVGVQQESLTTTFTGYNLGDTELFIRKKLWQDAHSVISIQPTFILPSPDNKNDVPKIGADNPMEGVRIGYGRNFYALGKSHYADIAAAYIHRIGRPSDQWKFEATLGLTISEKWQVIPQLFATQSTKKIKSGTATSFTQSSADDYDIVATQLSLQYTLTDISAVQLGGLINIDGKNTGAGYGVLLSYVRNF